MLFTSIKNSVLSGLALISATSLVACGKMKVDLAKTVADDSRSASLSDGQASERKSDDATVAAALTFEMPEGQADEFDNVRVTLCTPHRPIQKYQPGMPPPGYQDTEEPTAAGADPSTNPPPAAVAAQPEPAIQPEAQSAMTLRHDADHDKRGPKPGHGVEHEGYGPGEDDDFMMWPMPHPGHMPGWCEQIREENIPFKAKSMIALKGLPAGPVRIFVAMMKKDQVLEVGFGKTVITPGKTATATIKVMPVTPEANELVIKIIRPSGPVESTDHQVSERPGQFRPFEHKKKQKS